MSSSIPEISLPAIQEPQRTSEKEGSYSHISPSSGETSVKEETELKNNSNSSTKGGADYDLEEEDEKIILASVLNTHFPEAQTGSLLKRRLQWGNDQHILCSSRAYFILKVGQYVLNCSFRDIIGMDKNGKYFINHPDLFNLIKLGEATVNQFYLENHVNDEKFDIRKGNNRRKNVLEQAYFENELKASLIKDFKDPNIQEIVRPWLERLFTLYREGITLDQKYLTFHNFQNNLFEDEVIRAETQTYVNAEELLNILAESPKMNGEFGEKIPHFEEYIKLYFCRSFLINAVFFQEFAELIIKLFGDPNKDYSELVQFARIYGITQQLVNDTIDYVPFEKAHENHSKLQNDTFSDSRRRLITLPIIWYFLISSNEHDEIYRYYRGDEVFDLFRPEDQWKMLQKLHEKGALKKSMCILNVFAKYVEKTISFKSPHENSLNKMMSLASCNKYYKFYNELDI